jgi:Domain of unknown function (DUF3943)
MTRKLHLVGLVVAALAAPARADSDATGANHADPSDQADPGDVDDGRHYIAVAATWAALELGFAAAYYWSTQGQQEVDWTRPSWIDKLTFRSVRFDTNPFSVNALRHPLTGIGDYQIARSNGFGMLASTIFTYLSGAVWEYGVEYYEDPAINDLIMNGAGGLALGEPLYQIGQLWRGGELSVSDRLCTAAFSPFAATQDLWRSHRVWRRRQAWRDFTYTAGAVSHRLDDGTFRHELAFGLDIDVVRHTGFVVPGAHDGPIGSGTWSRLVLGLRLGHLGAGSQPVGTELRSQTALAGTYTQDVAGNGRLLALATAFTYRRDRLAREWDHLAIAHLFGPQLQLSRRDGETELRWDLAGYGDFGLVDAHVFGPVSPLPAPPPYRSTLQAQGYYNAAGASVQSRVRADRGAWHVDLEVTGHQLWSLDFADRVQQTAPVSRATVATVIPVTPHGTSDLRIYGHAELGVRWGLWGIAATAEAAYRQGRWRDFERTTSDWIVGGLATASF